MNITKQTVVELSFTYYQLLSFVNKFVYYVIAKKFAFSKFLTSYTNRSKNKKTNLLPSHVIMFIILVLSQKMSMICRPILPLAGNSTVRHLLNNNHIILR